MLALVCGLLKESRGKINQLVGKDHVCLVNLLYSQQLAWDLIASLQ